MGPWVSADPAPPRRWWAAWTPTRTATAPRCACNSTARRSFRTWRPWCASCSSSSTSPRASSPPASSSTATASPRGSSSRWAAAALPPPCSLCPHFPVPLQDGVSGFCSAPGFTWSPCGRGGGCGVVRTLRQDRRSGGGGGRGQERLVQHSPARACPSSTLYLLGCGESLGWGTRSGGHLFRGGESRDRGQDPCTLTPGATQRMVGVTVGFKVGTLLFSVQLS